MRRLLQFGTLLLLSSLVLAPLIELLDRWDTAGLENDSEMAVCGLAIFFGLLLAVCAALIEVADDLRGMLIALIMPQRTPRPQCRHAFAYKLILPPILAPLRI